MNSADLTIVRAFSPYRSWNVMRGKERLATRSTKAFAEIAKKQIEIMEKKKP